ncbi:phosphatidylcholine translocator ABCB4-like [Dermacentor silvarum]|uniref:phosphatidylcholine translocator ABCB4-like n=1 Tax=Dermacentor silvarum TaxID=543639 RepID=UPI002101D30F|nr:phosphatidylcholine translocator ABCB4-like [Dermacentor silvarum]
MSLQECIVFVSQFRYATAQDIVLLFLGTVFAILHGAGWLLLAIVFGHMTNAFIHQQQAGFYDGDSTNFTTLPPPRTFGEAIRRSGAQAMFDPVTILEYNITMNKFALTYVIIAAGVFVSSFIHVWCWTRACDRQLYRLRQELFYSILRQDAAWFDSHRVTEVASRMSEYVLWH